METMVDLIYLFWGAPESLKMVTAAMKLRRLLLGRKVMTNLDSILKSRDITLPPKVCLVKAMVFPVVIFAVSWTSRRSNQSILKEISPEYSLEGLMLKLKLQYFGQELTHLKRP